MIAARPTSPSSVSAAGVAWVADLGLITAGEGGTYHQFGFDLQRLVRPSGINLTVHRSKGSVDNIFALSRQRGVQMGIVQSDVLGFVAGEPGNPTLTRAARSLRLVFPLYDEEVHVLGRREIGDFDDLAGARVAIGPEGSGTYLRVPVASWVSVWSIRIAISRPGTRSPSTRCDSRSLRATLSPIAYRRPPA